jgi:hypothetical protein
MARQKPAVAWFTFDELSWLQQGDVTERFQHFSRVNLDARREIVVTPEFATKLRSAGYRGAFDDVAIFEHPTSGSPALADEVAGLRSGTTYALGILRPYREYPLDEGQLKEAWSRLTGGSAPLEQRLSYTIAVGEVGRAPALVVSQDRPFRVQAAIGSAHFDIRMESWLPTDTIRRAGFGQVLVNRRHVLTLDRGLSFAALGILDEPSLVLYRSGIFAPIPRLLPWAGPGRQ